MDRSPRPAAAQLRPEKTLDFLKDMLAEHSGDLVAKLTGSAGLSSEAAEKFIPAAGSATVDAIKSESAGLDLTNLAAAGNVSSVMSGIDVGALASKVGISAEQTTSGMSAILPTILGLIGSKAAGSSGGVLALLGLGGGLGGVADKIKGMGGLLG